MTVDQMRSDYFQAPGHSATMSGRFPIHTGIVMNSQGVNNVPAAELIGAPADPGASPMRFRGTTLTDWMKAVNPQTRVLSVSRKDRGAILPIGAKFNDRHLGTIPTRTCQ